MDGGAWWAAVHRVAKGQTRLSDFTFTFHFHALEKEMATHSSVLAWRIPGTGEPGGLPSVGSQSWTRLKWLGSSSLSSKIVRSYTLSESESCLVMFDSLWTRGLYSPWSPLGHDNGVGSLSLLQGIFPTQGSNPGLSHCRQILYQLSHKGSSLTCWSGCT